MRSARLDYRPARAGLSRGLLLTACIMACLTLAGAIVLAWRQTVQNVRAGPASLLALASGAGGSIAALTGAAALRRRPGRSIGRAGARAAIVGVSTILATYLVAAAAYVPAEPGKVIHGRVANRRGQPIVNALLVMTGENAFRVERRTDIQGEYRLIVPDALHGPVKIRVSAPTYLDFPLTVDVATSPSLTNIVLDKVPPSARKPPLSSDNSRAAVGQRGAARR